MKDVCDAAVVARMVRKAMESGEIRASAQALSQQLRRDVADGGSSATEFKKLVAFIEQLSTTARTAAVAMDDEEAAVEASIRRTGTTGHGAASAPVSPLREGLRCSREAAAAQSRRQREGWSLGRGGITRSWGRTRPAP
uniref:Uncharacterized protein n=1 Tax=Oryza meridionalis TaxID=40149 RepID=A0A0E0EBB8_9ORYZ